MDPIVATLLAKGLGLLGNAVLAKGKEWVENKVGVKLTEALSPEAEAKLRAAQMEHEEELLRIQLESDRLSAEMMKVALADTADARAREVAIASSATAPLLNKLIAPVLALVVTVGTFALFAVMLFGSLDIPAGRKEVIIYILGVLSALSTQIVAYYFGSSHGSKVKDETIARLGKL